MRKINAYLDLKKVNKKNTSASRQNSTLPRAKWLMIFYHNLSCSTRGTTFGETDGAENRPSPPLLEEGEALISPVFIRARAYMCVLINKCCLSLSPRMVEKTEEKTNCCAIGRQWLIIMRFQIGTFTGR